MTDKKLKQDWKETAARLQSADIDSGAVFTGIPDANRRTSLEQLSRRYTRFAVLGILMGGIMITQIEVGSGLIEVFTLPGCIAMCAIFFIAGFTDIYLRDAIRSIDVQAMSVAEVTRRSRHCRKIRLMFVAVMLPLAIATLVYIACVNTSNVYLLAGLITGAAVGLAVGIIQLLRFLSDYRSLR